MWLPAVKQATLPPVCQGSRIPEMELVSWLTASAWSPEAFEFETPASGRHGDHH